MKNAALAKLLENHSQKKLANLVGCSQQTISAWLNGSAIPPIKVKKLVDLGNGKVSCSELRPDIFEE